MRTQPRNKKKVSFTCGKWRIDIFLGDLTEESIYLHDVESTHREPHVH